MKKLLIISVLSMIFIQNTDAQSVLITPTLQTPLQVAGRTLLNGRLYFNSTSFNELTTGSNLAYGIITAITESEDSSDVDLLLYQNGASSPWLNFGKARGTFANPTVVQNNDDIFQINGFGYIGNDFNTVGTIQLFMDGVQTANSTPSAMIFKTVRNGSLSSTTSMSIRGTGFVGIGDIEPEQNLSVQKGMNIDQEAINDGTLLNGLRFGSESKEGIASRRTGGNDSNFKGLDFFTNNAARMTITNAGNVGIGTNNPTKAKLVVDGNINSSIGNFTYFQNGTPTTGTNTTGNLYNYSIYASNRIAATEFNAFSDARIKNIQGVSNNEKDLETLAKIEITDYQFRDKMGKGNGRYKKVIAQQVEGVYPQAVSKITDCIPDIYQLAKINGNFIELPNHNLKIGERVKLIFGDKQEIVEVLTISDFGFTISEIQVPSSEVRATAATGVFVYGREVADFRAVDYEALSMLNISATQALLKQLNDLKAQNEQLKTALEENKNDFKQLKAEINALKNEFR
jgi:hypothetical protein